MTPPPATRRSRSSDARPFPGPRRGSAPAPRARPPGPMTPPPATRRPESSDARPSPGPREESARARWRRTLNGLHIWQKLLMLGAVFALLFAIPTSLYFREVAADLVQTGREID